MKRFISTTALTLSLSLLFIPTLPAFAAQKANTAPKAQQKQPAYKELSNLTVKIDETTVNFPQKPIMYKNIIMLPVKPYLEVVGYKVTWDQKSNKVRAYHNQGDEFIIKPGSNIAVFNDEEEEYDVPAMTINGTLYADISLIGEALYKDGFLDEEENTLYFSDYEDFDYGDQPETDSEDEKPVYNDNGEVEFIWKKIDGEWHKFDPTGTYGLDRV